MTSSEIRQRFFDFFKSKGHTIVESDLLVPADDPTLLFTGAGMNQFKEKFMGKNITYTRAASCQKCLRTGDLENVGKTPRHHTFFEMLGNFSFGDYFKKEAIMWAWEFLTGELKISAERLRVSVHVSDEEAYRIWKDDIGVSVESIVKLGDHENFWPADAPLKGPNGPCGPCSEIFYDRGKDAGCDLEGCGPSCGCERFVEIWNLVFTQFERKPDGKLDDLPSKNIDTGMGLERIASVVSGASSNFGTDLFLPIIQRIQDMTGKEDPSVLALVADHARAAVFIVNDGVAPSNEKRGYVARKLIRRACLKGGEGKEAFVYNLVPIVADLFNDVYPELKSGAEHIAAVIKAEEERFIGTLSGAMPILEDMMDRPEKAIDGEGIFKLVDTYGMPVEIIVDICADKGIKTDLTGFNDLMKKRKEESRKGSNISCDFIFKPDIFSHLSPARSLFGLPLSTRIKFMAASGEEVKKIGQGDCVDIVLDPESASFYAESGGQVGDKGIISKPGAKITVLNTVDAGGRKVHNSVVEYGSFISGDEVNIDIDPACRKMTEINHTATHLLQAALREVVGDNVKQSGSLVDHKRLRFDFTHLKKLSEREIVKVENTVNTWIAEKVDVCIEEKSLDEAKKEGALSFFGDKYGETVRVVKIAGKSIELCGGTHTGNTGDIGFFAVVAESSVASGIRRIEAVTGDAALEYIQDKIGKLIEKVREMEDFLGEDIPQDIMSEARGILDGRTKVDGDVLKRYRETIFPAISGLMSKAEKNMKKNLRKKSEDLFKEIKCRLDDAVSDPVRSGKVKVVSLLLPGAGMSVLKKAVSYAEKAARDSVIILGGEDGEKAYIICAMPGILIEKGLSAKDVVCSGLSDIDGSGGGKEGFAQAGGKHPGGVEKALASAIKFIEKKQEG